MRIFLPAIILFFVLCALIFNRAKEQRADFVMIGEEPRSLDPMINTSLQTARVLDALFEGLTVMHPKTLEPIPGIAKSWNISEDLKIYTFHLRKALWSNGDTVKAKDFLYSWKRVIEPASISEYMYMLFPIKNAQRYYRGEIKDFSEVGVRAVDDTTLIITLENPTPYFLLLTAFITYMPVHEGCIKQHGIHWTKPGNIVTNGAFSLKTHLLNRKMRLVKSRTYWNHSGVRLKIIDVMPMESNNTAFNTYESGGADFSSNDLPVTIQEIMNKRSDYHNDPWLGTYLYRFNVTRPPFNDVRVRKAMNMCINREYIVKYITRGGQRPTTLLVPPSLPGYKSPPEVPYNTDSARSLLSQAGYANGINFPKTELLYNTFEHHKMIAEAVCHMWKKELGITVIPVNKEWKVLLEDMKNMNFSIIRGSWIGDYPDPNTFIDMFVTNGGNNNTGWGCPLYDSLVFSAAREADNIKRMEIFRQAEYILIHEGVCIMPIYFYVTTFLYRSNIHGIYPNPLGYIYLPCIWKES